MPLKRGRPRVEFKQLDKAFNRFGGVLARLREMDSDDCTLAEMQCELKRIGDVQVSTTTISKWLKEHPVDCA